MVINCLECYRVHKCGEGVYYCPFFGINPCQRGKHVVVIPGLNIKRNEIRTSTGLTPTRSLILRVCQFRHGRITTHKKYHNKIFTMLRQGMTIHAIAKEMGIANATLDHYVDRY